MNLIKDKLPKNKALITKADKGSSLIIIYQNDYEKKSPGLHRKQRGRRSK